MPRLVIPADSRPSADPGAVRRRFASADLRALLSRRLMEFCGLLAALVALGLAAALLGYDPADPSLNTATTRPVSNLAGPAGAVVADILLQGFGYAAALPVLALL
ncbi:MAG: DNA translocase FtsK 4TM domain-containing protein, partial [Alphaproteobacteria bacterium]